MKDSEQLPAIYEVTPEESLWLLEEAIEPLETMVACPFGSTFHITCRKIHSRPDDEGEGCIEIREMFVYEYLRLW